MSDASTAARSSAVHLLDQILGQHRLLPECLAAGALSDLQPQDRARAQRLALETLRGLDRTDHLLDRHLQRPPPLSVHNALRLGATEICQGQAAHGVVNAMVSIIGRHRRHARLKGLVNAVLRKIAQDGPGLWDTLPVPQLPVWLRQPLEAAWGATAVEGFEYAHFSGAPLDITCGPGADRAAIGGEILPTGSVRLRGHVQVSALAGYDAGNWWVQDAAAALPALVLAPAPDEEVLDLCAAPGGKTLQLASAGAQVTALDISQSRMHRLRQNLERTGLAAQLIVGDALDHGATYDAILLDAPCSATGTIRRHPDLAHAKSGEEITGLCDLQSRLLRHAWSLVRPGGRLVFCTCSLLPDEGEVQIAAALAAHPDMRVDAQAARLPGVPADWLGADGAIRTRPDYWRDLGGIDGFYIACLSKAA